MRFIRTEIYFDREALKSLSPVPGVSIAWAQWRDSMTLPDDALTLPAGATVTPEAPVEREAPDQRERQHLRPAQRLHLRVIEPGVIEAELPRLIALALRAEPPRSTRTSSEYLVEVDASLIENVLTQDVVIEHSPPSIIKLKDIMDGIAKNPHGVGAVVGLIAAKDYPELMLISVPVGIYVVGSAPAVTAAIQRGLIGVIDALFEKLTQKLKPNQKPKPKKK
jgi:hypothetical protein